MEERPPERGDGSPPTLASGMLPGKGRDYWDDKYYSDHWIAGYSGWNYFIGGGGLFLIGSIILLTSIARRDFGAAYFGLAFSLPTLVLFLARPISALSNQGETALRAAALHRMLGLISLTVVFTGLFWKTGSLFIHPDGAAFVKFIELPPMSSSAARWACRIFCGFAALVSGLLSFKCWYELFQAFSISRTNIIRFLAVAVVLALFYTAAYNILGLRMRARRAPRPLPAESSSRWTGEQSYEALAARLASGDKATSAEALKTLEGRVETEFYPVPDGSVEPLLRALRGDNEEAAAYAAQALFWSRREDGAVLKELLALLKTEGKARGRILDGLRKTAGPISDDMAAELKFLASVPGPDRKDACRALVLRRPSGEAMACLMDLYHSGDLQTRREAAYAATMINYPLESRMGELSEIVADPDDGVSLLAASVLWNRRSAALPARDGIIKGLAAGSPEKDSMLLDILAGFGPAAAPAAPKLVKMLSEPKISAELKCLACGALGAIGPAAAAALPRLDAIAAGKKHPCAAAAGEAARKIRAQ